MGDPTTTTEEMLGRLCDAIEEQTVQGAAGMHSRNVGIALTAARQHLASTPENQEWPGDEWRQTLVLLTEKHQELAAIPRDDRTNEQRARLVAFARLVGAASDLENEGFEDLESFLANPTPTPDPVAAERRTTEPEVEEAFDMNDNSKGEQDE